MSANATGQGGEILRPAKGEIMTQSFSKHQTRQLYDCPLDTVAGNAIQIGKSMDALFNQLAAGLTLENTDLVLSALAASEAAVRRLRIRLSADEQARIVNGDGDG